jgi:hypothetical protein
VGIPLDKGRKEVKDYIQDQPQGLKRTVGEDGRKIRLAQPPKEVVQHMEELGSCQVL